MCFFKIDDYELNINETELSAIIKRNDDEWISLLKLECLSFFTDLNNCFDKSSSIDVIELDNYDLDLQCTFTVFSKTIVNTIRFEKKINNIKKVDDQVTQTIEEKDEYVQVTQMIKNKAKREEYEAQIVILEKKMQNDKEEYDNLKNKIEEIKNHNRKLMTELAMAIDGENTLSPKKIIYCYKPMEFANNEIDLSIFDDNYIIKFTQNISDEHFLQLVSNITDIKQKRRLMTICCRNMDKPNLIKILIDDGIDMNMRLAEYPTVKTYLARTLWYRNYQSALYLLNQNADIEMQGKYDSVIEHTTMPDEVYQAIYDNAVRNNKLYILKSVKVNFPAKFHPLIN